MDAFVGEIQAFGFSFAPRFWGICAGQYYSINQNPHLFSIVGIIYGGNGNINFRLPDLQGRAAVGEGSGPGLSFYSLGEFGGTPFVSLEANQLPSHNHQVSFKRRCGSDSIEPCSECFPNRLSGVSVYSPDDFIDVTMNANVIGMTGKSNPHENRQPYLTLNYCICFDGIYPSRS